MRKSAMIEEPVKNELNQLKESLGLKNDTDTIVFLLSLYKETREIPKAAFELLVKLQR
ncbi:hypothetical protein P4H46_09715 [Paenibacillus glucanolyticus]|uniref:hypothetical protein n=1 Tax=Paenibacillus glucanolyticus TaxID=59843 RepID=UPI0022ADD2A9|nr:hypothetical protein [Staphylococcus aureus]